MSATDSRRKSDFTQLGFFLLAMPFVLFFLLFQLWPAERPQVEAGRKLEAARVLLGQVKAARDTLGTDAQSDTAATKSMKAEADKAVEAAGAALVAAMSARPAEPRIWLADIDPDRRLLLLVAIAGALGSSILAAKTFAYRMGSDSQKASWLWWYFLRLPTGAGIAVLLYFVFRGGLFAGSFSNPSLATDVINPYGFVAISALTGMFAGQASDKLEEIFEGLFRTLPKAGWPVLANPPALKAPVPPAETIVRLSASGTRPNSTVVVDGKTRDAHGQDDNGLSFRLTAAEVTVEAGQTRTFKVKVTNPGPPERSSDAVDLVVQG
jgi:hypothetical protein